jgi:hypothetical protein
MADTRTKRISTTCNSNHSEPLCRKKIYYDRKHYRQNKADQFLINQGVQGCPLSPVIFNLYLDRRFTSRFISPSNSRRKLCRLLMALYQLRDYVASKN